VTCIDILDARVIHGQLALTLTGVDGVLSGLIKTDICIIVEAVLVIYQANGRPDILLHKDDAGKVVPVMPDYIGAKLNRQSSIHRQLVQLGWRGFGGQGVETILS
jgi:hypothetical protein